MAHGTLKLRLDAALEAQMPVEAVQTSVRIAALFALVGAAHRDGIGRRQRGGQCVQLGLGRFAADHHCFLVGRGWWGEGRNQAGVVAFAEHIGFDVKESTERLKAKRVNVDGLVETVTATEFYAIVLVVLIIVPIVIFFVLALFDVVLDTNAVHQVVAVVGVVRRLAANRLAVVHQFLQTRVRHKQTQVARMVIGGGRSRRSLGARRTHSPQ